MKITVAMDNTVPINAKFPFLGEHGSSLLLEADEAKILIDAGQSSAVVSNLSLLGIAPSSLDMAIISHGHYDHAGGLYPVLQHAKKELPVYAHPGIFTPRFSISGGIRQYIGIPYTKDQLTSLGARWNFVEEPFQLTEHLWISGSVPRITGYEQGDTRLVTCCGDGDCQDPIQDDMSIYYVRGRDMVVIGGCTHSGLVNTVKHGFAITGATRLAGWIGGTHLGPVSPEQQTQTLQQLDDWKPDFVAATHCTGFPMMSALYRKFGSRYISAFIGAVIEW